MVLLQLWETKDDFFPMYQAFQILWKAQIDNFFSKSAKCLKKRKLAFVNNLKWRNNFQEKLQTVILNTLMKHRIFCKDKLVQILKRIFPTMFKQI